MTTVRTSRCRQVPEVIQTSGMDCGPAVLTSLLRGYGIAADYARLRDACRTDIDGTSIDDLERIAQTAGLEISQTMLPLEHLLLPESSALPAVVVTQLPGGFTHFVLVWRRQGDFVQIMDPIAGRRWLKVSTFLQTVHVHSQDIDRQAWFEWAKSTAHTAPLERRLLNLGLGRWRHELLDITRRADDWRAWARLDAALRLVESLSASGLNKTQRKELLFRCCAEAEHADFVPSYFYAVRAGGDDSEGESRVNLTGAVLLQCDGRSPARADCAGDTPSFVQGATSDTSATFANPGSRWRRVVAGHWLSLAAVSLLLIAGAAGGVIEALLFRATLEAPRELALPEQRVAGVLLLLAYAATMLLIERLCAARLFSLGRQAEGGLRLALFEKLPRLSDEYLATRPTSDTAERIHSLQQVRVLPRLAGEFVKAVVALALTATAISWIDPHRAPLAIGAAVAALAIPWLSLRKLRELDLRVHTHAGALSVYYYDALLGLSAVRAHHAEQAVCREHESLLVEWQRAARRLLVASVTLDALQSLVGFGLAGWMMALHSGHASGAASALLMAYWALSLPALGDQIVQVARQYPSQRSVLLRMLEPLLAREDGSASNDAEPSDQATHRDSTGSVGVCDTPASRGWAIDCADVRVQVSGRTILSDVNLHIDEGCHVAIVGPSGAGKSTLLSLLLGWIQPTAGTIRVGGVSLNARSIDRLRSQFAWVDPATQLWNRSLVDNLTYGLTDFAAHGLGDVLGAADLLEVVQRLPEGMRTSLGEGGALLSGGEGQRVRLGRAITRPASRVVLLDEPFRGLDRGSRRQLLQRTRARWADVTLLCVTHDVSETLGFDRVLVVDLGRIVDDGSPEELMEQRDSRFYQLLCAERSVHDRLWNHPLWRRVDVRHTSTDVAPAGPNADATAPCSMAARQL